MSWLRVDDKFPRHGKVAPLTDPAFRMHVHAMAHCAEHETDGFLDDATFETLTRHKNKGAIAKELEGARGFRKDGEPLWKRVEGGWQIHDYLQWNPSHAELESKRVAAKVRAIVPSLRALVIDRDCLVCGICRGRVDFADVHIDHVVPVSKGGKTALINLRVTHSKCNLRKGGR